MKVGLRVAAGIALATLFIFSAYFFRPPPDPIFEGRFASQWAQDLLSPDYTLRGEAQTALKVLGEPAVPQLRALLNQRSPAWEKQMVRLNSFFPSLKYRPVDAIGCRERASDMLGLLGPKAHSAVPDLIHALRWDQTMPGVARALVRIGPASVERLCEALTTRGAIPSPIRAEVARLLREFAPLDDRSIAALIHATADKNSAVRQEAATSLGAVGPQRRTVATALLPLARDSDPEVRAAALASLGHVGIAEAEILAALHLGLRDPHEAVELEAAKALWKLKQNFEFIVPTLIKILTGNERRWQAAYTLGEIGPHAAAAVPRLIEVLQEEQVPRPFRTPPSSAFALGKIGEAAIPQLCVVLAHRESRVRIGALLALSMMGKKGQSAAPHIAGLLKDEVAEVRHTAALALASVGAPRANLVSALADCLSAEDIAMRSMAAAALRDIAPDGDWVIQPE